MRLKRLFANAHIFFYRFTGGVIGHRLGPAHVLLLTTTGHKTGKRRVTPITYFPDGSAWVLVASNYGAATDPIWLRNLRKQPRARIQIGGRRYVVVAEEAAGVEKERLARIANHANATYTRYQRQTERDIPLVILRPVA